MKSLELNDSIKKSKLKKAKDNYAAYVLSLFDYYFDKYKIPENEDFNEYFKNFLNYLNTNCIDLASVFSIIKDSMYENENFNETIHNVDLNNYIKTNPIVSLIIDDQFEKNIEEDKKEEVINDAIDEEIDDLDKDYTSKEFDYSKVEKEIEEEEAKLLAEPNETDAAEEISGYAVKIKTKLDDGENERLALKVQQYFAAISYYEGIIYYSYFQNHLDVLEKMYQDHFESTDKKNGVNSKLFLKVINYYKQNNYDYNGHIAQDILKIRKNNAMVWMRYIGDNINPEDYLSEYQLKAYNLSKRLYDENMSTLIEHNLGLIKKVASNYEEKLRQKEHNNVFNIEDFQTAGIEGLMKAILKIDPKIAKLSTYSYWWIKQSIERFYEENSKAIRVSVHMLERIKMYERTLSRLKIMLGHEPTDEEIMNEMGINDTMLKDIRAAQHKMVSFDEPISDERDATTLGEMISDDRKETEEIALDQNTLSMLMDLLDETFDDNNPNSKREKEVVLYRCGFYNNRTYTLEELGKIYGVTRERIRQIEAKAFRRLRNKVHYNTNKYIRKTNDKNVLKADYEERFALTCNSNYVPKLNTLTKPKTREELLKELKK
ncbi:MAG: sigma-70 family RNA polymerase sigma factor [Bacilli bacterium]|nr:sigma-70 family RNA polymerase sigma factor [Bacilli bacterium]